MAAGYTYGTRTGDLTELTGFGSGDALIVRFGDEPIQTMGDLDNNCTVNKVDVVLALKHISGTSVNDNK